MSVALLGPGVAGLFGKMVASHPQRLLLSALSLLVFLIVVALVVWIAIRKEQISLRKVGFDNINFGTIVGAIVLSGFFIFVYGPIIYGVLSALNLGDFSVGMASLHQLPAWYLGITILIVAGGEEWLYRAYSIERLESLTGSPIIAGAISLIMFFVAHLPLWGVGASATTLVSGAILTMLYIWKRDILMLILAHVGTDLYGILLNR